MTGVMRRSAILLLLLLGACGRGESTPAESLLLVHYTADPATLGSSHPDFLAHHRGLHWFGEGWGRPRYQPRWMLRDQADLWFEAYGRECRLQITFAPPGRLGPEGQDLSIAVNGTALATVHVPAAPDSATVDIEVPDAVLVQGINRIGLRVDQPGERNPQTGLVAPRAGQLRSWVVGIQASEEDRARMNAPIPDQLPDDWDLAWSTDASPPHVRPPDQRPDILVLVLDALRADHVHAYGYPRETTPRIDALAADGVRFDQVFSTAAVTRVATPSLLTGLSWREHRTIQDQTLAPSVTTLVEVLRDAGFATLGFSHNPHVSRLWGMDQGFEEFVELWSGWGQGERQRTQPYYTAERVVARLEAGLPAKPVFAYVHMLPPHVPYVPGEAHDHWSDPDYTGQVVDGTQTWAGFSNGNKSYDDADRQRLIDLYDGNLHRADAMVGQMVDAWRALGRDRELLVVVTSDHGEGFAEHGRFGHGHMLYPEVTHIPLVVSPRSLVSALAPAAGQLRAISDILPMVMHVAGVALPQTQPFPKSVVSLVSDPTWKRSGVLQRTRFQFALRTDHHLTIFGRFHGPESYDLATDPGATRNLWPSDGVRHRLGELQALLSARWDQGDQSGPSVELTEDEEATLRSLGYTN